MNRLLALLFILFRIAVVETSMAQNPEVSSESIDVLSAFAANWEALGQFDLSMRHESFSADPEEIKDDSIVYRMIGDFERNRFLFVYHGTRVKDTRGLPVEKLSSTGAFVYDESLRQAWRRVLPDMPLSLNALVPQKTLALSHFPDPRRVGGYDTPRNFDPMFDLHDLYRAQFHSRKPMQFIEAKPPHAIILVDDAILNSGKRFRTRFTFDLERYVPLQITYSHGTNERETTNRVESLEWDLISGIYLPSRVLGELMTYRKSDKVKVPRQYDVQFYWTTVNEDDLPDFNTEILRNDSELLRLIEEAETNLNSDKEK